MDYKLENNIIKLEDILVLHNDNPELALIDAIQEYALKNDFELEEIVDVIEDDNIFKELLHIDLIKKKYVTDEEVPDVLALWGEALG